MTSSSEPRSSILRTSRLEAFSDGVLAIIITIMVLEIRPPHEPTWHDLKKLTPVLLSYVLSFVFVGIYWNNHHHLFRATRQISPGVMWANMGLLFCLSLIPAVTIWVGESHEHALPAAVYGGVCIACGVAYFVLSQAIIACNREAGVAEAIGHDAKGILSVVIYAIGAALAYVEPWLAYGSYALVSLIWVVPDPRLRNVEAPE
jgi:uncharacterized membrane protein